MVNKITRETEGIDFDLLIEDFIGHSQSEHRRGSNFFTNSIIWINEEYFPEEIYRQYDGYWETNTYIRDTEYGADKSEIDELTRVEKKTKTITETYWEEVK